MNALLIYNPDACYERARRFLSQYYPVNPTRDKLSDYATLARSMLRLGVCGEGRARYWKFFLEASTRYRRAFDTAMMLAIMGFHFQTLTRSICQGDIESPPFTPTGRYAGRELQDQIGQVRA